MTSGLAKTQLPEHRSVNAVLSRVQISLRFSNQVRPHLPCHPRVGGDPVTGYLGHIALSCQLPRLLDPGPGASHQTGMTSGLAKTQLPEHRSVNAVLSRVQISLRFSNQVRPHLPCHPRVGGDPVTGYLGHIALSCQLPRLLDPGLGAAHQTGMTSGLGMSL